ncbi:MAG: hypothetical protein JWL61_1092 [Gemmatimonadetes bacterium]|nr:hypothetical protein [Gemmatimonadota bacterium]
MPTELASIQLLDGRTLLRDQFYAERDHRTQVTASFSHARVRIALVLSPGLELTEGGQTAFIWAASMVRRMGRPFAELRLVSAPGAHGAPYLAGLHRHLSVETLGEAMEIELLGSDPFSEYSWREFGGVDVLAGVDAIIGFGIDPSTLDGRSSWSIQLGARGWVVHVPTRNRPAGVQDPEDAASNRFDCAASAAVAAACIGVARAYDWLQQVSFPSVTIDGAESHSSSLAASDLYWSIESGHIVNVTAVGSEWLRRGSSEDVATTWRANQGAPPLLRRVALISAGGIGGNLAQILSGSYLSPGHIAVIDPDRVDVGNLNRLIGVLTENVSTPKAELYAAVLSSASFNVEAAHVQYEDWAITNRPYLDAPECISIVGADQVGTRLNAQADWPRLLLNGSTAGTTWTLSQHPRGSGGCLGCIYANDRRPYSVSRGPQACAAVGGAPSLSATNEVADASYPFVSVSAAAALTAVLLRQAWERKSDRTVDDNVHSEKETESPFGVRNASVSRMNMVSPAFGQFGDLPRNPECLLVCSDDSLRQMLGAVSSEKSAK